MAELHYVDWDGLVYYDGKVKQYIGEKLQDCLKMGGLVTYADLPSPSFQNLNYIYKITEEFISSDYFKTPGYEYSAGTWVQVTDFDGVYLYSIFNEATIGGTADLTNYYTKRQTEALIESSISALGIEELKTSVENNISDIGDLQTDLENLETTVKNISTEGFVTEEEVNDLLSNYITDDDGITEEELIAKGYATEQFVKDSIDAIEIPQVDLSNYYNKTETETLVNEAVNGIDIPDTSNFITMKDVEDKGYITDISGKADKSDTYTKAEVDELIPDNYLTSDTLADYVKKSDMEGLATEEYVNKAVQGKAEEEHTHSYNDLTDKPTIPSIEGLATEKYVDDAIAGLENSSVDTSNLVTKTQLDEALGEKADDVLFTTSKLVKNPIGSFTQDEDIKDYTLAVLFTKLLGLDGETSDSGYPFEEGSIAAEIFNNKIPLYEIDQNDVMQEVPYTTLEYNISSAATTNDGRTGFYVILNDDGSIAETGYQHVTTSKDPYYIVALPEALEISAAGNVELQSWNTTVTPNAWTEAVYVLTSDYTKIVDTYNKDGFTPPTIPEGYKLWADLSKSDPGTTYRFIIKE